MIDEVLVTHRHDDGDEPMTPVDDDRVDGLRVREFTCRRCGFAAGVLSRVEDEQQGASWPYAFRTPTHIS